MQIETECKGAGKGGLKTGQRCGKEQGTGKTALERAGPRKSRHKKG